MSHHHHLHVDHSVATRFREDVYAEAERFVQHAVNFFMSVGNDRHRAQRLAATSYEAQTGAPCPVL
jgi:hypothetical protein